MQETRRNRLAAAIQQELSRLVRDVKDPRVGTVTFTRVEITTDGSQATVSVALLGAGVVADGPGADAGRTRIKDCIEGLASASGFLRRQLGQLLTVRHVPTLLFREDRGIANVSRVHELLKQVSSERRDE